MEVEHGIRGDGEEIRNLLHRIKRTVDKGWPVDMEGIAPADHGAERTAQGRQRRQRYIEIIQVRWQLPEWRPVTHHFK